MKFRKYSKEQLIDAVKTSNCLAQTLSKLGVSPAGGNYDVIKKYIKNLNLDITHFRDGRGWSFGLKFPERKRPLEIYLSNQKYISSNPLKNRLFDENVFERKCYKCNFSIWMGEPIPLELDHINGNSQDNRLENLRILCPTCHAQTPTYRGKNIQIGRAKSRTIKIRNVDKIEVVITDKKRYLTKNCIDCKCSISKSSTKCRSCAGLGRGSKIDWPPLNEIISMVEQFGYSASGRKLGVSDKAVKKHIKNWS